MFKQYQRIQTAELRPYIQNEDMANISTSQTDKLNGSPKQGDMIAWNPANHNDQWLVAEQYFKDNFVEIPEIHKESDLKEISLKYLNQLLVGKKIKVYANDKDNPTDVTTYENRDLYPYQVTMKVIEVGASYEDYYFKLAMLDNPNYTVRLEAFSENFTLFD